MLPLLSSSIPPNANMFMSFLTQIAAFDVIEIGEYVEEYLSLDATDPISAKFESIGMESLYFINNVGSFFLVLMFEAILVPL